MTTNIILNHLGELSEDAMVIANHDVNHKHGTVVWENMVKQGVRIVDGSSFYAAKDHQATYLDRMRLFEDEILALRFDCGESVVNKKGQFIRSKVSATSTYRSNKSIISNAIAADVRLVGDDGEPVPKSALEKQVKDAKEDAVEKTPLDKAMIQVKNLAKIWPQLDASDMGLVDAALGELCR